MPRLTRGLAARAGFPVLRRPRSMTTDSSFLLSLRRAYAREVMLVGPRLTDLRTPNNASATKGGTKGIHSQPVFLDDFMTTWVGSEVAPVPGYT
jgi:hypothetical protein